MTSPNLFTNSATATSYTAVNANPEGSDQTSVQALYQQASNSSQPDVVIKRQFEQQNQDQKTQHANEFIESAGREGIYHLASTPEGQHALAVVYDHAGSEGREFMREVHEEQGNTAVDYTHRDDLKGLSNGTDNIPTGTTHTEENKTISDTKEWGPSEKTLNGYHIYLNAPEQYKRQVECLNGCHATGFNVDEKQYVASVGDVFGADLAVNATEYYASKQIETGNPLYAVAGSASALMLPENQDKTELVLSLGASLPSMIKGGASLINAMRRSGARDIDELATMRSDFDAPNAETRNLAGLADNEAGFAGRIVREVEPGKYSKQIDAALKSTDPGVLLEGQVGKALDQKKLLLDYQSKIRAGFTSDGKPIGIGEIDAETPNYIIEIASGAKPGKIDQLKKLQNSTLINPDRKPVVLFAPKVVKPQQIKAYEKIGIQVVNDYNQLFKLNL